MLAADAFSAVHEATSNSGKGEKIYDLEEVKKVTNRFVTIVTRDIFSKILSYSI
jgi:hypothetical protein